MVDEVREELEEDSTDANVESEEEANEMVSNTVLLFVGNNYDNVAKNVTLKFVKGENSNYMCPITPIEAEFGANSKRDLFTLIKEDPTSDSWGELSFVYEVSNVHEAGQVTETYDDSYYGEEYGSVDVGTGDDIRPPVG